MTLVMIVSIALTCENPLTIMTIILYELWFVFCCSMIAGDPVMFPVFGIIDSFHGMV